jgi:hypothetical protein
MFAEPRRVQRKRTPGFKLQEAGGNGLPVFYVGRPTIFGNPWTPKVIGRAEALRRYEAWLTTGESFGRAWLDEVRVKLLARLPELRGQNLACFCSEDDSCHADVLLRLANQ